MDKKLRVLVIAGAWNMPLFTVDWVNYNLFDHKLSDDIKPRYSAANHMIVSKLFQFEMFEMGICPERLCFIADQNNNQALIKIADIAERIANLLPHTPYVKFDVNYQFERNCIRGMFATKEDMDGYTQSRESRSFSFTAIEESNKKINVLADRKASNMDQTVWDINHSYAVKDSAEFNKYFEVDIFEKNKNTSLTLIEAIENEYRSAK